MCSSATARVLTLMALGATLATGTVATALAASPTSVPLAPYPVAAAMPVGDSVLPQFVDDDELVRGQLNKDGSIGSMVDDLKIKIRGGGDYALHLPGPVLAVADQGGDSVPGLAQGRVSFLGHLDAGQKLLAAEATLDPRVHAAEVPVRVGITYHEDGSAGRGRRRYTEAIEIDNVTGQTANLIKGAPDPVVLARALDALYGVPAVYTPEINLGLLYPMPTGLALRPPLSTAARTVYVPMSIDARVHLESDDGLIGAGGADVKVDSRGTDLHWVTRLPQDAGAGGQLTLFFTFSGAAPLRVPAVDIRAQVLPLPAAGFTPTSGVTWTQAVRTARNLPDLAVLAQAGALSLHRIGDLAPPIGRPGAGPERVSYELVLASGQGPKPQPTREAPLHPQPWAILLAFVAATFLLANGYWAWSRH